jgi:hypothetical protein
VAHRGLAGAHESDQNNHRGLPRRLLSPVMVGHRLWQLL